MADRFGSSAATGGGDGTAGNPYTLQEGADNTVAGETFWVKADGTYTVTAQIDFDINAGGNNWIYYEGYATSTADNGQVTIEKTGAVTNIFDITQNQLSFKNFHIDGADGDCIESTGSQNIFINIKCTNAGSYGISIASTNVYIENCEVSGCVTGMLLQNYGTVVGCIIHDNNAGIGRGILTSDYTNIVSCLFYNNIGDAIFVNGTEGTLVMNCTFDAGVGGVQNGINSGGNICTSINNIFINFDTAAKYAITTSNKRVYVDYNAFYNNTNDIGTVPLDGGHNVTLSVDPFVSATTYDYTLNDTATGGADCHAAGFPGTLPGSATNIGYMDIGAFQAVTTPGLLGTFALPADVQDGVSYGAGGTAVGGLIVPSDYNVISGIVYGSNAEWTGGFVVPSAAQVELGVGYGSSAVEFTGTAELAGTSAPLAQVSATVYNQLMTVLEEDTTLSSYIKQYYRGLRHNIESDSMPCIVVEPVQNNEIERDMGSVKDINFSCDIIAYTYCASDDTKTIVGDGNYRGILDIENDIRAVLQGSNNLKGSVIDLQIDPTVFDYSQFPVRGLMMPVRIRYRQLNAE